MTFIESISIVFKKYAVFKGRASRSEFWWWLLVAILLVAVSAILEYFVIDNTYGIVTSVVSLILFLPYMAVSVRRCHDSGHTGWWILCPIANIIMMFLPSEQADNKYGIANGLANANKPTEKILAGCSIALILPMLLLCVICVWLISAFSSVKLSADEAPYSTTEHLRELSGMTFLPSVKFIEGVRSNWDNDTHYYFEWENPLTEQDKQRILKYAKKSRYQQLWEYPEDNENSILVQKVLSKNEIPYIIHYFKDGIKLEYVTIGSIEYFLDGVTIPAHKLVWCVYYNSFPDDTAEAILQLSESYVKFKNELIKNGYEVVKNTQNKVILQGGGINIHTSIEINKNTNVVELWWETF